MACGDEARDEPRRSRSRERCRGACAARVAADEIDERALDVETPCTKTRVGIVVSCARDDEAKQVVFRKLGIGLEQERCRTRDMRSRHARADAASVVWGYVAERRRSIRCARSDDDLAWRREVRLFARSLRCEGWPKGRKRREFAGRSEKHEVARSGRGSRSRDVRPDGDRASRRGKIAHARHRVAAVLRR